MTTLKTIITTTTILTILFFACNKNLDNKKNNHNKIMPLLMKEKQISFSPKNHALDNNDNFSPDNRFLCYDTRGTVYNENLANCKSIEKIEIATGTETVLWEPESVTGEKAAPGVAAVSWHPKEDKVIFIHGPLLEEVEERGYYAIINRTGVEVSADGKDVITKVDMRDVATDRPTAPGAQRGGTHRHEYTRNGNRIGFTYDDFLNTNYDRTIGYLEPNQKAPAGYTHYFAVLIKPAEKGKSKSGEIEKAYGDSWVDTDGKMRAFIGKVRAENGVDYQTDLFVANISDSVDITSAFSGNGTEYPEPPAGIQIRRLTQSGKVEGIVRGSHDGKTIAFLSPDSTGILQVFVIDAHGSDLSADEKMKPRQLTTFTSNASAQRWHPSKNWVFAIVNGNIAAVCADSGDNFGKTVMLTSDDQIRGELVVSNDGNTLAYSILKPENENPDKKFRQIFVLELNWEE
jgi:dipeptidyl aminopeptidase/acylaminoacyl peptidase